MRKSSCGIRRRCEPLDLTDPVREVGDTGEHTGVDGVPTVQAPAGQPYQNPGIEDVTDEGASRITLSKRKELVRRQSLIHQVDKWGLSVSTIQAIFVAPCASPDTSVPLQTPSKLRWWALSSQFRELLIDPQEDPGSTSISM